MIGCSKSTGEAKAARIEKGKGDTNRNWEMNEE